MYGSADTSTIWHSCTEKQMHRKKLYPWACLHIITPCAHTCPYLPWRLYLGCIPTTQHFPSTHTHRHMTDAHTKVFQVLYHTKAQLGLNQSDSSDKNMLIMVTSCLAGTREHKGYGEYSEEWMSIWINDLMENGVVNEWQGRTGGGLHWDPKRCVQAQMAFVCESVTTLQQEENMHTHTFDGKNKHVKPSLVKMPYGLKKH